MSRDQLGGGRARTGTGLLRATVQDRCCCLQGQGQSTRVQTGTASSFQTSGPLSRQLERWQLSRIATAGDSASQMLPPFPGAVCAQQLAIQGGTGHQCPGGRTSRAQAPVEAAEPPLRPPLPCPAWTLAANKLPGSGLAFQTWTMAWCDPESYTKEGLSGSFHGMYFQRNQ